MKYLNYMLAISALVVTATGCIKENTAPEGDSACKTIPATLSVPSQDDAPLMAPSTKVSLNGTTLAFTWNSGDKIAVMGVGAGNSRNEFTTTDDGVPGAEFSGDVTITSEPSMWVGVSPFAAATAFSSLNGNTTVGISATQTGNLSDVGTHYLSIASSSNRIRNAAAEGYEFYMNAPLTPFCSIVKINVPSALKVTRILFSGLKDSADHGIAGTEVIKLNAANVCKSINTDDTVPEIEITRGGSVISGDVYICVLPDTQLEAQIYKSSADAVKFRLEKSTGAYWEKEISLNADHPLAAGKLMNFGTVSTSINFTQPSIATPVLSYTNEKKLVATCANAGVTFYYTTNSSCEPEDPNTSSDVLPAEGVTLTSSQYIKVIAALDDDAVSSIAEANLRYWDYSSLASSATVSIPASGQYDINSWFYLTMSDGNAYNNVSLDPTNGIKPNTKSPAVYYNVLSQTTGHGYMYVRVTRKDERYLKANINAAGVTNALKPTNNAFELITDNDITQGGLSYVYQNNGTDGYLRTFAFFEVGDVDFPAPTCLTPSFTYADGKVYATSTNGATIYYTVGDSVPADPTASSEVFPTEGLALTSGKYFKAYAVKDGYNNSSISTGSFRKWSFGSLNSYFDVDITAETNDNVTSNPAHYLYTDPINSDWITLSSTNSEYVLKARCGKGYSVDGSREHFSYTNLLNGTVKLYLLGYRSKDTVVLTYKPSSTAETQSCAQGVLVDGSYSLAVDSAEIEAGETSEFYLNKGHRVGHIVVLESGTSAALMSISNQSFE